MHALEQVLILLMVERRAVFTRQEGSGGVECRALSIWHGDVAGDMRRSNHKKKAL